MEEVWKPVVWYEWFYEVSNLGNIKSIKRGINMKWYTNKNWYEIVHLSYVCNNKAFYKHRLVAISFIENKDNLPCVCHISEDKNNKWWLYNWVDNLFWWTHQDNALDMHKKWRWYSYFRWKSIRKWTTWEKNPNSKKVIQLTKDWTFINEYVSITNASNELQIFNSNISECCNGKRKSAWWFLFAFK